MEHKFEKESILIEWVPYSIMAILSLMFFTFSITSKTVIMIIGSLSFSIVFAFYPVMIFSYLKSFRFINVFNNTIEIVQNGKSKIFTIPDDLGRVRIGAYDLQIELKKNGDRFVLRSHFLKNKSTFNQLFDRMIKDHPPSKEKVILKSSLLEIMDRLKTK
jgi:hypothetical protein